MSAAADPPENAGPVVDAEFFDLILETDLANIIQKAKSGAPLTKREREMIEAERTRLANRAAPASFHLEGEGPKTALDSMTQEQLAGAWGYSVRSIKGWLADGRAKNDPCPLKKPGDMVEWFERVHAPRQAPEKLRGAVSRVLALIETGAASSSPSEAARTPVERVEISEDEKGMIAMLNRHRTAEAELHAKYMDAVANADEAKMSLYMREWSNMGQKLRQLEKDAPKALQEMGIYVRKDDVIRELEPLHRAIMKSFRQTLRVQRIRLKNAETAEDWNRLVDELVDEVGEILVMSEFAEPLVLEEAA